MKKRSKNKTPEQVEETQRSIMSRQYQYTEEEQLDMLYISLLRLHEFLKTDTRNSNGAYSKMEKRQKIIGEYEKNKAEYDKLETQDLGNPSISNKFKELNTYLADPTRKNEYEKAILLNEANKCISALYALDTLLNIDYDIKNPINNINSAIWYSNKDQFYKAIRALEGILKDPQSKFKDTEAKQRVIVLLKDIVPNQKKRSPPTSITSHMGDAKAAASKAQDKLTPREQETPSKG